MTLAPAAAKASSAEQRRAASPCTEPDESEEEEGAFAPFAHPPAASENEGSEPSRRKQRARPMTHHLCYSISAVLTSAACPVTALYQAAAQACLWPCPVLKAEADA